MNTIQAFFQRLIRVVRPKSHLNSRANEESDETADERARQIEAHAQELAYASQWKLMSMKFKRHKVAVVAGVFILLAYLLAIFADFVGPYDPNERFTDFALAQPTRISFVDEEGQFSLRPFVFGYERRIDEDTFQRYYVQDL